MWIFGAIESESKKLRLEIIPDNRRREDDMKALIEKHIAPGSLIVSDAAKFYFNVSKWGYDHQVVNHSETYVNEEGFHTNTIESTWRTIRKSLGLGRIKGTLDYHICEVLWRRYCEKNKIDPFENLLQMIAKIYPG